MKRTALIGSVAGALALSGVATLAIPAAAHAGSLSTSQESLTIPTWLFLLTGGGAVGASFLLASFVTDRTFIGSVHSWHRRLALPARTSVLAAGRAIGVFGLCLAIVVGFLGPPSSQGNLAILLVWVGWWAGFTMSSYLLGNAWPVLNPWRTLARSLPAVGRAYPNRLGAWPSVAALLGLIWIEIVSPIATDPRALATLIVLYSIGTLAGAVVYGSEVWFRRADPIARVFRCYGRVAPLTTESGRLRVRLPGSALTETRLVDGWDEIGFVIALLWGTTFDGLVLTPAWETFARGVVSLGIPSGLLYPTCLAVGFGLFFGVYRLAARRSRASARTYRSASEIARRFAPSLLAIWVAHAAAYDLFPGRLQAIRSQYALTAVMVFYTAVSLWVVSQPSGTPPFV